MLIYHTALLIFVEVEQYNWHYAITIDTATIAAMGRKELIASGVNGMMLRERRRSFSIMTTTPPTYPT